MISTGMHGLIDWAVAAALGKGSKSRVLSPPVRAVLGTAAVYHAGYSAVTNYEAGVRPWLTMRQHLLLDALGGAAFIATALMTRRLAPAERALLLAAGLSELAVVAYTQVPGEDVTYAPVDILKPVADEVFIVDSALPGLMGKVLPVRMTVIRLSNGDLLLHSPVRFSKKLNRQLQSIGRIAHFVAPNVAHWTFLRDWQRACPNAMTWAAPGLRQRAQVRRSGVQLDYDLRDTAPALWGDTIKLVMVRGGFGFHEAALFHQPSRTLVLTDLVVNLELAKVPWVIRPIVRLFGMAAPDGMPPPYLRAVVKLQRQLAAQAMESLVDLRPERVIFAHGQWFRTNGAQSLRRSLRWMLD